VEKKFQEFVQWGFQALLLAIVTWGVSELAGVNKSIQELNIKMAVIVAKGEFLERVQEAQAKRIDKLESKQ
jgi:hypothetical protein